MRRLLLLGLLLAMAGCSANGPEPQGLTADEIGLSPSNVFDTPDPEAQEPDTSDPGEGDAIPRAFAGRVGG